MAGGRSGVPSFLSRRLMLAALGVVMVALFLVMRQRSNGVDQLALQRAGSPESLAAMLAQWSPDQWQGAVAALRLDFVFLLIYPAFFAGACVAVASRLGATAAARLGRTVAWLQPVAGLLDLVEDLSLLQAINAAHRMLASGASIQAAELARAIPAAAPGVAWWCSSLKLSLLAAACIYLVIGGIMGLRRAGT